jgi:acyl-CoA synthetase (AMP-forming)/AMP-acid ligase II
VHTSGAEQVAAMIYTSGTTGTPKGVMLTHRGILYIASISGGMRHLTQGQRVYGVLPMSHVFGLASVCVGSLYNGACLYPVPRFEAPVLVEALVDERITVLQGVPAMYARMLDYLTHQGVALDAPALIYISAGGSPLDADIKRRVEAVFGQTLHNGYGLTEASPTISQTRINDTPASTTVGRVLPLLEYRLEPLGNVDAEASEAGELWVRGPNVMRGYFRQPEATRACLDDAGWLNTGDIARVDAAGELYIVGRSKELIIRSGFNIYPPDVEAVINEHPEVTLSAVVGREVAGNEEVIAFVQCATGTSLNEEALRTFVAERLAPYKRPCEIFLVDALPATATGKILKGRLRQQAQEGYPYD